MGDPFGAEAFLRNARTAAGNADTSVAPNGRSVPLTEAEFNAVTAEYKEVTSQFLVGGLAKYAISSSLAADNHALDVTLRQGGNYAAYVELASAIQD